MILLVILTWNRFKNFCLQWNSNIFPDKQHYIYWKFNFNKSFGFIPSQLSNIYKFNDSFGLSCVFKKYNKTIKKLPLIKFSFDMKKMCKNIIIIVNDANKMVNHIPCIFHRLYFVIKVNLWRWWIMRALSWDLLCGYCWSGEIRSIAFSVFIYSVLSLCLFLFISEY